MATVSNLININDNLNVGEHFYTKVDVNNPSNRIESEKFYNEVDYLLAKVKREYQDICIDKYQINKNLENISNSNMALFLNEQYVKNSINQKNSLNTISSVARSIANAQPSNSYPTDSLNDLFNDVKQSITAGKNDYLDVLKNVFSQYMDFVKMAREELSNLSESVKAGSKDGYINIDTRKLIYALSGLQTSFKDKDILNLQTYFKKQSDGRFYREINGEKIYYKNNLEVDKAAVAIEKLLSQIKGVTSEKIDKSSSVRPDISFLFNVNINLLELDNLIIYLKRMPEGPHDILQTEFELIKKTLDTFEKNINTNLDELSKKYSSVNSNYDNFVKIVSSTMNTLLEMAKGFLRF
ncbi:IpaD/SipD/SspD family type III secretion system needle tip protein [Proteus terrae]|uniref:IpaD/SipD/SspD family type III secretion system needle tip protein n=1 Tax=Proteus terrae TaxID=1574161 RepID=UPI000C1699C6|nr:IpaD/SipD/SspD family type III secretion system needle tip protein [Proteus terrae]UAX01426.1 IpaD/SipD/SspD family type III secretion system needle tip protein [Proteus terrae subsp. cibarius]